MTIFLTRLEIALLDRQRPSTRGRGGFQSLLVGLALRVNRSRGRLVVPLADIERIPSLRLRQRRLGKPPAPHFRSDPWTGARPAHARGISPVALGGTGLGRCRPARRLGTTLIGPRQCGLATGRDGSAPVVSCSR